MLSEFEKIFHEYYSPLCNYAAKVLGDDQEAEDLVQSLFIEFWENKKLSTVKKLGPFLIRSVKFKCIDLLRKKSRLKQTQLFEHSDNAYIFDSEIQEDDIEPLFYYFASKLPPKTRIVFLKSRKEGMSYKEIAEELNVSIKTVENQMGIALKKLRRLLKNYNFLSIFIFL